MNHLKAPFYIPNTDKGNAIAEVQSWMLFDILVAPADFGWVLGSSVFSLLEVGGIGVRA